MARKNKRPKAKKKDKPAVEENQRSWRPEPRKLTTREWVETVWPDRKIL